MTNSSGKYVGREFFFKYLQNLTLELPVNDVDPVNRTTNTRIIKAKKRYSFRVKPISSNEKRNDKDEHT